MNAIGDPMSQLAMEGYYVGKQSDYFSHERRDILALLPEHFSRVFELGCGSGSTLRMIRSRFPVTFSAGLDIDKNSVQIASRHIDLALYGNIETMDLPDAVRDIDVMLCLDVLEHLIDPWAVVRKLHKRLSANGVIIASIPNIRYFRASIPFIFAGRWNLEDQGILDRTHLRFFVKKTAVELMTSSGLYLQEIKPTGMEPGRKARLANLLTLRLFEDFLALQYLVRAGRTKPNY